MEDNTMQMDIEKLAAAVAQVIIDAKIKTGGTVGFAPSSSSSANTFFSCKEPEDYVDPSTNIIDTKRQEESLMLGTAANPPVSSDESEAYTFPSNNFLESSGKSIFEIPDYVKIYPVNSSQTDSRPSSSEHDVTYNSRADASLSYTSNVNPEQLAEFIQQARLGDAPTETLILFLDVAVEFQEKWLFSSQYDIRLVEAVKSLCTHKDSSVRFRAISLGEAFENQTAMWQAFDAPQAKATSNLDTVFGASHDYSRGPFEFGSSQATDTGDLQHKVRQMHPTRKLPGKGVTWMQGQDATEDTQAQDMQEKEPMIQKVKSSLKAYESNVARLRNYAYQAAIRSLKSQIEQLEGILKQHADDFPFMLEQYKNEQDIRLKLQSQVESMGKQLKRLTVDLEEKKKQFEALQSTFDSQTKESERRSRELHDKLTLAEDSVHAMAKEQEALEDKIHELNVTVQNQNAAFQKYKTTENKRQSKAIEKALGQNQDEMTSLRDETYRLNEQRKVVDDELAALKALHSQCQLHPRKLPTITEPVIVKPAHKFNANTYNDEHNSRLITRFIIELDEVVDELDDIVSQRTKIQHTIAGEKTNLKTLNIILEHLNSTNQQLDQPELLTEEPPPSELFPAPDPDPTPHESMPHLAVVLDPTPTDSDPLVGPGSKIHKTSAPASTNYPRTYATATTENLPNVTFKFVKPKRGRKN